MKLRERPAPVIVEFEGETYPLKTLYDITYDELEAIKSLADNPSSDHIQACVRLVWDGPELPDMLALDVISAFSKALRPKIADLTSSASTDGPPTTKPGQ